MAKVRVGIIGTGNCAPSLIQGVHYYQNAGEDERACEMTEALIKATARVDQPVAATAGQ